MSDAPPAQFRRVAETGRRELQFTIDGRTVTGLEGDTLLTALLMNGRSLRSSEFGGGPRAGFCLMGACQDCWVSLAGGERVRACSTYLRDGLAVLTGAEPAP